MMPLWILRHSVPDMKARAIAMLERVGLGHRLNHYPSQISGGEMARAGVARALAGDKPLILADEPTGNLDRANSEKLADLLWELQSEIGFTLIIVTHDMELARRVPARHALRNGRLERIT
jgi:lipoprotein-releasing system ATP-binding protein